MNFERPSTQAYHLIDASQSTIENGLYPRDHLHLIVKDDVITFNTSSERYETCTEEQLNLLWEALERFLINGGSKIAIELRDNKDPWQQQASFVYHLLKSTGNKSCELLLIDSEPNVFSGLLSGAVTAFSHEAQIKIARISVQNTDVANLLPSLFYHCFSSEQLGHYHLENNKLSFYTWQAITGITSKAEVFSGNVLITGGAGAIGQLLAEHLFKEHHCQVFLTGRKPLSAELAANLKKIKAKAYFQADCTQFEEMQDIVHYINNQYGALNHIFHLAGNLNDSLFVNKQESHFLNTIEAKLGGAQVIAKIAEHYKPRSVTLFSSLSAVTGNIGQTDYAAANASLNELAKVQNGKHQTQWSSINWGLWETEKGMQMPDSASLLPMKSAEALALLDLIHANNLVVTTVYNGPYQLLNPEHKTEHAASSQQELATDKARTRLKEIIVECTKIKNLDDDVSLLEKGVDSIIATHIAIHIEKELTQSGAACKIPKTLIFQHASVNQIFAYLMENHLVALQSVFPDSTVQVVTHDTPVELQPETAKPSDDNEHFAIVAAAGEFPEAVDLHEFWELIKNGNNAIKPIPKQRWDWQEQFSLDVHKKGKSYCRQGGFIQEAALFDNTYFKITPRDAQKMTPEARRLLHQSYYALEQCNFLKSLKGNVAVFVANMYAHYQNLNKEHELVDSSLSAMANHISYAFGFNGASMGVDSMCSGGLNALHVALNSLTLRDCDAVLVGAANIMSHPGKYRFLSEGRFLSPSGKCQSFGIGADGYVPGEGCVVLVIKRLNDAKAAHDKILGVIRGSAVNSNGAHSAMTVPSATAQAQVIKKALTRSGLHPEDISYIETHGTGTALGDPIEISGLNQVYSQDNKIAIGSLKSNIGHLEAAAGLASLVKVVLQMHYRMKVPSLHCDIENPLLGLEQTPFIIQKKLSHWGNDDQQVLYAGVSAFGAGGANGHVILESPPRQYAYEQLPRVKNKLNGIQAFWIDLQSSASKNKNAPQEVAIDKEKSLWMTKKIERCASPLINSQSEESACLFLVTAAQKQILLAQQYQCLLLDDAVVHLDAALQQQPHKKYVVVNLTALDENEEDSYLSKHFDFAKSLTAKRIHLDLILVNPLGYQNISVCRRAAIDGLYRTLKLEHSTINTLVMQSDDSISHIAELVQASQIKDGVSGIYQYSRNEWQRQVFSENEDLIQETHTPLLKEGGVYIISGGLGALGQIISKSLLSRYNAQVICLGRSALTGVKWEQFQKLKALNHQVAYYQADITDAEVLAKVITEIISQYGQINGVINSTCVLNDGLLSEKSFSAFSEVIKSKIQGTVNLDEATKELALDFFVSFSSMSAVYSNVGQADYCMANTFVDYFTYYREGLVNANRRQGKSMTINWPLWEVDGLSLSKQTIEFLCEATGIDPLNEQQGMQLFERLLDAKHPAQIIPLQGNKKNIRAKLLMEQSAEPVSQSSLDELTASVIAALSEVTHQNPAILTVETGINELGMSSVLLTELAGLLEKKSGVTIAPSAFFSHNTVLKIAQYLNQKMPQQKVDVVAPVPTHQVQPRVDLSTDNNEFAIIGFSALLPTVSESESFWEMLLQNKSAVRQVSRWDGDYFAATLDDIKHFDNQFFNLSNREAMLMDPQHRLFLQESYKALLDAGYPPAQMKAVGVFAGVQFNDYQTLLSKNKIPQHPYMATGNSHAMLANRVSYLFDFNGPSQTVDTACSSTLVAINRGILALKNNECELALCGAVSLLIDSGVTEAAKSMGVLSPNYRCATFDEQADGYVRGEGAGVFVLKRLKDALRDKDAIHAVIAACAENHGGKANSLTAPNPVAQKELLLKAYTTPSLAGQVSYIETHGTGTKLGDPIEIDALTQAFSQLLPNAAKNSILLGSVKTNVGHLEPAAGVASMVKVIYALKHGIIPANLHFNKLNPYIDLQHGPFKIAAENTPWEKNERVAGISSFGFGGSYAHVVLKQAPSVTPSSSREGEWYFPLSARKPQLLQQMKKELLAFLRREKSCSTEALSYMLTCRREHFKHRFVCKCSSLDALILHLQRDDSELSSDELMQTFMAGNEVSWGQYFSGKTAKLHIPGYAFEHKEFWFDSSITESVVELAHE